MGVPMVATGTLFQRIDDRIQHWPILRGNLMASQVRGPMEHDARVVALCIGNGVRELLTADRAFDRFPELA